MANRVAIVGIGQSYFKRSRPDVNQPELVNEVVRTALADAQLSIKDIDAVFASSMEGFEWGHLADHWMVDGSGAFMKPGFRVSSGGNTGASLFDEAFQFVASGLFGTTLVVGHQKQDEGQTQAAITCTTTPVQSARGVERPPTGAVGFFAYHAATYMRNSGAKEEHAAKLRLQVDQNACRNPHAHLRLGLKSVDEVLTSRVLVWPLRLLDYSPQSCGACAVILAPEEQAKKITDKPVWIADTVCAHQDLFRAGPFAAEADTEPYSQEICSAKLYKRNGITNPRKEIDMAEIYDPSTWEHMSLLEHHFWCEKNKGWTLIDKGITAIEGEFPVNPSGGIIATNAIGASPLVRIAECTLQIRGDAGEHQVTKEVKTAVATALGGTNWTLMTLLKKHL
jgi:acetyl-CoA C-acetyltransferase